MSTLEIVLTVLNVLVAVALVWITAQYTKATKKIAKLDEERKIWEVKPIIVLFEKKEPKKGHGFWQNFGLKNIGFGATKITALSIVYTESLNEPIKAHTLPFYLGKNEEFIWLKIDYEKKTDLRKWNVKATYEDIHGNATRLIYEWGELKEG